jgi:hypothetical protein
MKYMIIAFLLDGETTVCELDADHSPCISSTGNRPNISVLVETFSDDVEVFTYIDAIESSFERMAYEDLSEDVVNDIYNLLKDYKDEHY